MRTSLARLRTIEEFVSDNITVENKILFEANLVIDNTLANDVKCQIEAYKMIRHYGRQSLKSELEMLHGKLIKEPKNRAFWEHIRGIFQKN